MLYNFQYTVAETKILRWKMMFYNCQNILAQTKLFIAYRLFWVLKFYKIGERKTSQTYVTEIFKLIQQKWYQESIDMITVN